MLMYVEIDKRTFQVTFVSSNEACITVFATLFNVHMIQKKIKK